MYGVEVDGLLVARLRMTTEVNNNKYYYMYQVDSSTFRVEYGRIEKTKVTKTYPMSRWYKIYDSKVHKGYVDCTREDLVKAQDVILGKIDDPSVSSLVDRLQAYASGTVRANYTNGASSVTQAMIDKAQIALNQIVQNDLDDISDPISNKINKYLLAVYTTIPRLMAHTGDYLLEPQGRVPKSRAKRLISSEQDNLDTLAQQVQILEVQKKDEPDKSTNILDAMGVQIAEGTDKEYQLAHRLATQWRREIKQVYTVFNKSVQARYNSHLDATSNKATELFWHGTRNQNVFNIIKTGLLIRPTGVVTTGAMFGHGIYFADSFKKSKGYTSLRGSYWASGNDDIGYMLVFRVHVGNQMVITSHQYNHYELTKGNLLKKGYHSVYAKKGVSLYNSEYIIYDPAQCSPYLLCEVTN